MVKKRKSQAKSIKPHELSEILHEMFEEERSQRIKQQQKISSILYRLRRAISIPIIIGFAAAILMWWKFGWEKLAQTLLSWTIGLTLLVAIVTLLERVDKT